MEYTQFNLKMHPFGKLRVQCPNQTLISLRRRICCLRTINQIVYQILIDFVVVVVVVCAGRAYLL